MHLLAILVNIHGQYTKSIMKQLSWDHVDPLDPPDGLGGQRPAQRVVQERPGHGVCGARKQRKT